MKKLAVLGKKLYLAYQIMCDMKRIASIFLFAMAVCSVSAQSMTGKSTPIIEVEQASSMPKTDWLTAFDRVKVDGQMNVVFKKVNNPEEARITYDTKGDITTKFKFEIDKNGRLVVSEKLDPKRTTVTDIIICYHTLKDVKIAHAKAKFENKIEEKLFDLTMSGGALVDLEVNTLDVAVECTGTSRLTLSGQTKYLTMNVSTAKVDCSRLDTVSTTVEASHSAEVRILVSERLEVTTSTSAKLLYKGHPVILRSHMGAFGGDVIDIN